VIFANNIRRHLFTGAAGAIRFPACFISEFYGGAGHAIRTLGQRIFWLVASLCFRPFNLWLSEKIWFFFVGFFSGGGYGHGPGHPWGRGHAGPWGTFAFFVPPSVKRLIRGSGLASRRPTGPNRAAHRPAPSLSGCGDSFHRPKGDHDARPNSGSPRAGGRVGGGWPLGAGIFGTDWVGGISALHIGSVRGFSAFDAGGFWRFIDDERFFFIFPTSIFRSRWAGVSRSGVGFVHPLAPHITRASRPGPNRPPPGERIGDSSGLRTGMDGIGGGRLALCRSFGAGAEGTWVHGGRWGLLYRMLVFRGDSPFFAGHFPPTKIFWGARGGGRRRSGSTWFLQGHGAGRGAGKRREKGAEGGRAILPTHGRLCRPAVKGGGRGG